MSKKKDRKPRPLPKPNRQIPNSLIRPMTAIGQNLLLNAREYPLYGCWIMAGWKESGITPIVVAREQEPDRLMFGIYEVDLYCLGIKDAFTKVDYSLNRFKRDLPKFCAGDPEQCSIELAHEIIYGALEYAERLGFQPHPDFKRQLADRMLAPPDAYSRTNQVAFGKDGRPLFVAGPYDDERKCRSVINMLRDTCGEGKFDYIIGLDGISSWDE
jgi:hypothetical protein